MPGVITGVSVGIAGPDLWIALRSGHVLKTLLGPAPGPSWSLTGGDNELLVSSMDFMHFPWREIFAGPA